MADVLQLMPTLVGDEVPFIQGVIRDMTDNQALRFANLYNSKRIDNQTILFTTLLGFIGIAGIQRFIIGEIGMGFLYFFTAGYCFVGTMIDLVNYKELAFECNSKIAYKVAFMVRA